MHDMGAGPGPAGEFLQRLATAWTADESAPTGGGPVVVTGRAVREVSAGQRYLAMPPRAPRILLPMEARAATAGALTANSSLRPPAERFARRALAWAVRSPVGPVLVDRTGIGVEADGETLLDALRERWDRRVHALSFSIRAHTPNHKPTFLALDRRGTALGYGKLAPSAGTADRMAQEVDGLRYMASHEVTGLRAPDLLAALDWRGCPLVVVSPIPAAGRRIAREDEAPGHLLVHAQEQGRSLRISDAAARLQLTVARAGEAAFEDATGHFVEVLEERYGDLRLSAGRLHGDWVPWNLARCKDVVWAWDWEHSEPESIAALDVLHWHLHVARDRHRLPLARALAHAEEASLPDLRGHGLPDDDIRAVQALGRLRLAARSAALFRDTGLWSGNERHDLLLALGPQPGGTADR